MSAAARRFVASDGVGLAWYAWGEATQLPPVVLQHGYAASSALNWSATGVVGALLDAGRRVIAVDARGHGQSDKPGAADCYGEARMAQDLAELLAALQIGEFDLFGYSMGAVIGLLLASDHPGVRRLVVGGVGEGVIACGGVDRRVLPMEVLIAALRAPSVAQIAEPAAQAFRVFAEYAGNDLAALALQASRMHSTPLALQRVSAPTLVIAGQSDPLARQPHQLADALPQARWVTLAGDHLSLLRNTRFIEESLSFLNAAATVAPAAAQEPSP
ncbi:pimeloyl-ACP methyl ester carboxylesterase [Tahibacter aquaticus]|uniref:Pimeloyl-ACP methyl ester carboxylesterase n=1 Tax=Tahibacter aquaticus TaxID=520092 RepID=A0A4R6Z0J5_9GAMM|nr:alpha/beta hydrolase [Tahibacter aquaticus]TDR45047.1 pimeloyl-ACP methyl ester carboxylesterase [Tahibacter aquaticus]